MDLEGVWGYVISSRTALSVGFILLFLSLCLARFKNDNGTLISDKVTSAFGVTVSLYTFGTLGFCHLYFDEPGISALIDKGFGQDRFTYLLLALCLSQMVRFYDLFLARPNASVAKT
jgi:hypothetical protein